MSGLFGCPVQLKGHFVIVGGRVKAEVLLFHHHIRSELPRHGNNRKAGCPYISPYACTTSISRPALLDNQRVRGRVQQPCSTSRNASLQLSETTYLLQKIQALVVRGCLSLRFLGGLDGRASLSDGAPNLDCSIFVSIYGSRTLTRLRRKVEWN